MNILKLVFANIRKRKGAGITFLVMVMLAALMLSISLSLMIGGADFYDKKVDELNAPHYFACIHTDSYEDSFYTFAKNYNGTTDVSETALLLSVGTWKMKSAESTGSVLFADESETADKAFSKLSVIDKHSVKSSDMVILSYNFMSQGIKSGEKIILELSGKNYEFTVYGFYEDAITGASTNGGTLAYIDSERFKTFKTDENYSEYVNLSVRFEKSEMSRAFKTDFGRFANLQNNEVVITTFDSAKAGAMTFINMMSLILIAFSLIILVIAFIVVVFSISNSIAEDINTIGALKSIGYKNNALRLSQLIQYLLIAATGSIAGVLLSLFTFGFIGNIIAGTSGLLWLRGSNIIPIIITILILCGLTCLISHLTTRKYKKITPINALRQGESNHSFKKNVMPLEKYKLPLNLHLGIKRFFNGVKNNITLCAIVTLLVFVTSFVYILSYNFNTDRTAMIQMVGLEMSDVFIMANPGTDIDVINAELLSSTEVNHTILTGDMTCYINDTEDSAMAMVDYSQLTINTVVKGEQPKFNNEISLGSVTARTIGKDVGDTVTVEIYGVIRSYVVVGVTQNIANGGVGCNITLDAMLIHNSAFKMDTINVYLNNGVVTKDYCDMLKNTYGNKILIVDTEEQMDTILSSMGGPFGLISMIMIVVTAVIIAFVLFLIISALIRKQKKEFGIMKALGYKNQHLILQVLILFLPALIIGTVAGVLLGFVATNPFMSVILSAGGILKPYFIIPALPTILIGLGIFGVSVAAAYLIASRLKKISPQKLIVEN